MMARLWRLTQERDFQFLYRRGWRQRRPALTLYAWADPPARTHTRVGIVVSKRVATKATERNLYKRRLWAAVARNRALLPATGRKIVIVAAPGIKQQPYSALVTELRTLFSTIPHA